MLGELAGVAVSMAPAVAALRGGELASYHGVEHKAIAAYEQDVPDAAEAAKEHDRCGSHLIAPMVASNLLGTVALRRLGRHAPPWGAAAVSFASIGFAVEVFAWCERHRASAAARLLGRPGHSCSACSAPASPTRASSRSAGPRWPRSCGSRARSRRRIGPRGTGRPRAWTVFGRAPKTATSC